MLKPYTPHRIAGNCLVFLALWTALLLGLHEIRQSSGQAGSLAPRAHSQYFLLRNGALQNQPVPRSFTELGQSFWR
jgi:hypothetical protein